MKRIIIVLFLMVLPLLSVAIPVSAMEVDGSNPTDPDLVYLEIRADLDETEIVGQGAPTQVYIGIFTGYSLPIWSDPVNLHEELYFSVCVPDRYDEEHDIVIEVVSALSDNETKGNNYQIDIAWEKASPNVEIVPDDSFHSISAQRYNVSTYKYFCYEDYFVIDYDAPADDSIIHNDELNFRLRLGEIGGQYPDLDNELIILHVGVLFPRGDLLGEEAEMEDIGISLFLLVLALLALGLTIAMFATKNAMLGFPCVIFWAVLGAYAYGQYTTAWVDWQYYLFFASFGMVIFCALAAFGLREKRDTLADKGMEEEEKVEDDFTGEEEDPFESKDKSEPSDRTKGIRARAKSRRT